MVAHDEHGLALVFPGQGSQREGMAVPWADEPSFARWREADRILGRDVARLGLNASADELREPAACQVALFVHGVVVLEAWRARGGPEPVAVAGHSLGEYVSLVAAGVLGFADGLSLVHARATATQRAAQARPGTMVACLGYDVEVVATACGEAGAHLANDNAPGQVVVAGGPEALERLRAALSGAPGRGRVVPLEVGAAYHSPHMAPAVEPFSEVLEGAAFADARMPVVANVDALPHAGAGEWPTLLRQQLVRPVRWRETVGALRVLGTGTVVELGATAVLTGLVKRTDRSLVRRVVTTPEDLAAHTGESLRR